MHLLLLDGTEIRARSFDDAVAKMAAEKFTEPRSIDSYRKATANRVFEMMGLRIDTDTNKSFIESMQAVGIVKRLR